jgi:hypothetical protein
MLIYTPVITTRIQYIMKIMIGKLLQTDYDITDDFDYYIDYNDVKFAYCHNEIQGIKFTPTSLLFETDIIRQDIIPVEWKEYKLFFPVFNSILPFDPFAVGFYLITRYEEYLENYAKDKHGRFDIHNAISYKHGFHRIPMVNRVANEIGNILKSQFPQFVLAKKAFNQIDTYDIDIAYQYKGKNFGRFVGSMAKSVLSCNFVKTKKLILSLLGKNVEDKFDTYQLHRQRAGEKKSRPIHFVLTAPFAKYDRNISPYSKAFANLIQQLSQFSDIGLHPSYYSSVKPGLIKKEKGLLEKKLGARVTQSRQHYLKFEFPDTFNQLIENGIEDDYSLGWPNEVGFRASIAIPFPFFDLTRNCETKLMLHPLTIMDGALDSICSTKEEKNEIINILTEEIKKSGGEMVLLRHNSYSNSDSESDSGF